MATGTRNLVFVRPWLFARFRSCYRCAFGQFNWSVLAWHLASTCIRRRFLGHSDCDPWYPILLAKLSVSRQVHNGHDIFRPLRRLGCNLGSIVSLTLLSQA